MRPCFPVIIVVVHVATGLVNKDGVEPGGSAGTGVMPPLQCCTTSSTDSPTVRAVDSKRKCADTIMTQCRPKNMDFFELSHTFSRTLSSARLCGQPPSSGVRIVLLDITGGAGNVSQSCTDGLTVRGVHNSRPCVEQRHLLIDQCGWRRRGRRRGLGRPGVKRRPGPWHPGARNEPSTQPSSDAHA